MSDTVFSNIAVLGAGAWGAALAQASRTAGRRVTLWGRQTDSARPLFPDIALTTDIRITNDLAVAAQADALLVVVPAQALGAFATTLAPHLKANTPLVICAKGIEKGSGRMVTEIMADTLPDRAIALLSGPSFARDVVRGLPTAVTIAAEETLATRLQATLGSASFRPYVSTDMTGVALGGAAKNVYAIACGVVDGMGLGENARAALLARSFAELARLGERMGASRDTLMGLSGLGDLVLSATSPSSRNFSFGLALGKGAKLADLVQPGRPLAEGVATAPALVSRARKTGVEMPVAEAVADLLDGLSTKAAVQRLMERPFKTETA